MKRVAMLFPGQGTQHPGMGRALYERDEATRRLFDEASQVLCADMARLCFEAPAEELTRTENTQPALLLCSLAAYRSFLARTGLTAVCMAGHSLGELSALVAAEALSLEDGLRLAHGRGEAMARCTEEGHTGMQAVTKLERARVEEVCRTVKGFGNRFVIANFNAGSQLVLSGTLAGMEAAAQALQAAGATLIALRVSGAFHSPFMSPAAEAFAELLAGVEFKLPRVPVVANVSAMPYADRGRIADGLIRQVASPVLWSDTMRTLHRNGIEVYVDAGPREVLKKLAVANVPCAQAYALSDAADEAALERELAADTQRPATEQTASDFTMSRLRQGELADVFSDLEIS
jgi:[acyl-carrier-protein] S-malonyltransferase